MEPKTYVTADGYQKIVAELEYLRTKGRKEIAEKISEARSFGDLKENAEYDEAKNEQAIMEAKIAQLEEELKTIEILDDDDISTDVIGVGSFVKLLDKTFDEPLEFQIIGKAQADPNERRISDESPIGRALLGHAAGETVEAETPSGSVQLEILEISK